MAAGPALATRGPAAADPARTDRATAAARRADPGPDPPDPPGDDPIELVLSCPDGDIVAAVALADTVELVGVELRTLAAGSVGGPAMLPFAVGTRRVAQPHATFRRLEPSLEVQGAASDVIAETARHTEVTADLCRRLAAATGQCADTVAADLRGHRVLTAQEAMAYGLVDEIQRRLRFV